MEREVLTRDYLRFVQEGQDGSESSFVNDATLQLEYSIKRLLGYGACATCFQAVDARDGETVALKVIRRSHIYPRLSKYVERELSLHSELSHPFVVGFKRVFYTSELLVCVLEYASEGSIALFRWPSTYPKRRPLAIYFFQQLIAAVAYCHEHGIVHRDLKHENSLLHMATLPSGNKFLALKVADFGMCKAAMHSDPKTRVGTIPYMSPQVLQGERVQCRGQEGGRAADVYACGVHLYKMLFQRYPFEGTDAASMSLNIMSGNIVKPAFAVHPDIDNLLTRMLDANWQTRISVDDIMRHPAYLENLPSEVADGCGALPSFGGCLQSPEEIGMILKATLPTSQAPAQPTRSGTSPEPSRAMEEAMSC